MMCPGTWDAKTGEQTSPDFCVPHKNGECAAHCPQTCQDGDMMCPGKTHADGCTDADYCVPGSKFIFIYLLLFRKQSIFNKWSVLYTHII